MTNDHGLPLAETERLLGLLISYPTLTHTSNLDLMATIEEYLQPFRGRIHKSYSPNKDQVNLFASIGPENSGGIVLSGHSDVVSAEGQHWSHNPFTARKHQGRIYGRGSCDMKGFLACCLAMIPRFATAGLREPIHLAITYDEEIGCVGADVMLRALQETSLRPRAAMIGEPTEMRIVHAHKSCCEYTTTFRGLAGHGSAPDQGVNAIVFATQYAQKLAGLAAELRQRASKNSPFSPPCGTINIGTITGGTARNVIAESCAIEWEMRHIRHQDHQYVLESLDDFAANTLIPAMRETFASATITRETAGEVAGLIPEEKSEAVRLLSALVDDPTLSVVPFGTEAGLFQHYNIPAAVCGPGNIAQAHTCDEYIAISQLQSCLRLLDRLCQHLQ